MSRHDYGKESNVKVNRRTFIKGCTVAAAAMGLSETMVPKLVEAATSAQRPPVVWLHFSGMHRLYRNVAQGITP